MKYWFSILKSAMSELIYSLKFLIANLLPEWLVYHATLRLVAHATTGKHSATDVNKITAMEAIERWGEPN